MYLIEIEGLRKSANVEFPTPGIPDPTLTLLNGVAILAPNGMRQNLEYLLWLWIAISVTKIKGLL